ncbi:hypothetical protein B0H15DRAFT_288811 [Mycena belliarum]|uniref:Protein kinase domain-containing protein n=1 Tax=Mycena belliarum TaxID=1033014 RepID=A0AAD6U399_9AGAR|nr:hypothetical protein B0H15DRAFT_288811 [Mycena belliae]
MSVDSDLAARELSSLLEWNPPKLVQSPESPSLCAELIAPLQAYYDKHLHAALSLRHVQLMPSLHKDIGNVASKHFASVSDRGLHSPISDLPKGYGGREGTSVVDAADVASFYNKTTAFLCVRIASKLFLAPRCPHYPQFIMWGNSGDYVEGRPALAEGYGLVLPLQSGKLDIEEEYLDIMDEDLVTALAEVEHSSKVPGNWEIRVVSSDAEALVTDLGRLGLEPTFPYKICRTLGYPSKTSALSRPVDANTMPWTIPPASTTSEEVPCPTSSNPRRSARLNVPNKAGAARTSSSRRSKIKGSGSLKKVVPAAPRRPKNTVYDGTKLKAESFLQLAWCHAVRTDATIIVFHCGTLERIGVRHRQTQTLYLSDLIDVNDCKDPGYVKLHVGLYATLIQDSIDRNIQQRQRLEAVAPVDKGPVEKRPDDGDVLPGTTPKRLKTSHARGSDSETEAALSLAGARDLMLLYVRYALYDSQAPASFIRSAPSLLCISPDGASTTPGVKRSYREEECISITLINEISPGATGIAHNAVLQVVASDGSLFQANVMVKIAFMADQQTRMRHEYDIYKRLASFSVKGIPEVYGLFDDLEGGAIALVMSFCGICLRDLRPSGGRTEYPVSPAQRSQFVDILESIHRAGVRHHDIRAENLTITETGTAIIDFDLADLNPTAGKKRREMERLDNVLGGYHPEGTPSVATTQASAARDSSDEDGKE